MSYSRQQLYAMGEPFGECATRKEGGRIIYGGGGSSSAPPSTQTQVVDLPDWAKPYAKETLEKTKALTAAPYQTYGADRIAGFSPLQQQAQSAAAQMQTSQLGQMGGQLAGAATMGALGAQYDPFQMGQFTSGRAAQYMNPFVEMAMEPQLREAQRTSQMQRVADMGAATRAGAFGGSRQAIIEAERQRNLGTQLGDIRARGLMSAFDQAQQQFNREQQLREQSRQYGAGLGMQGLQTALQGAGQMGALGGQQFQQGMDINRLQQQVGAQQQALQQQGLTQAYQDFLNQQNYPYKQLGFMSDMIRGLPLGQQSTAQVYQAPGSMAGQIAGLGMGAYGLSRAFGFAEGGEVDQYAEGGVTSEENVESILDGLSDVQLQQAKVAALDRGDRVRVAMIDAELAQRASLRSGLGGAFDMLPEEAQESVFAAANGGMVAFSNGGDVDPLSLIDGGNSPESLAMDEIRRQSLLDRRKAEEEARRLEFLRTAAPEVASRMERSRPAPAAARAAAPAARVETPPAPSPTAKPPRAGAGFSKQEASAAVNTIVQGTGVQVPEDKTQELANTLYDQMMSRSKADRDSFRAELETAKGRAKEIEARGIGEALAKFGFGMAAAAAKPGVARRPGLGGVLESAAAASPILAESMAETQRLKTAAQDNYMKMRMDNARYESALEQGNMQLASGLANNISQRKLAQASLQQQIAQNERMFALEKEKLGLMRTQANAPTAIQKIANDLMQEDPKLTRKSALEQASRIAGYSFKTEQAGDLKRLELLEKVRKANPMYGALETKLTLAKTPQERTQILQQLAELEERAVGKVLSGSGVGSRAGWSIEPVAGAR